MALFKLIAGIREMAQRNESFNYFGLNNIDESVDQEHY